RHRVVPLLDQPADHAAADPPGSADDHDLHDVSSCRSAWLERSRTGAPHASVGGPSPLPSVRPRDWGPDAALTRMRGARCERERDAMLTSKPIAPPSHAEHLGE